MDERLPDRPEEAWDRFIDALDRAGQAGSAADVRVPVFPTHALGGKAFGELSRNDVKLLSRVASALGRRSDTILTMWDDMQRRARPPRKARKKSQRR
jgi:hypothetical protein